MHCQIFCVPTKATSALYSGVGEGVAAVLAQSQDQVKPALPPEGQGSGVTCANPQHGGDGAILPEGAERGGDWGSSFVREERSRHNIAFGIRLPYVFISEGTFDSQKHLLW